MTYEILLSEEAAKFLRKLDHGVKEQIKKRLYKLKDTPELGKPLSYSLSGLWSLRIDIYRVIYRIEKERKVIFVSSIGHRKNIYSL